MYSQAVFALPSFLPCILETAMKYQFSNTASNPRWVGMYVLHHYVTPIHNHLKATGQLDLFYNNTSIERNKSLVQAATEVGIENVYLEDNQD